MSDVFRILVCGGRDYGKIWNNSIGEWVTDQRAIVRLHRVLGETCCRTAGRLVGRRHDLPSFWYEDGTVDSDWIGSTRWALQVLSENGVRIEVIHGAARGADTLAGEWAQVHGLTEHAVPADWDKHGIAAGYIRNSKMLKDYNPDCVIGFFTPGAENKGTNMMCKIARDANVPVWRIE